MYTKVMDTLQNLGDEKTKYELHSWYAWIKFFHLCYEQEIR